VTSRILMYGAALISAILSLLSLANSQGLPGASLGLFAGGTIASLVTFLMLWRVQRNKVVAFEESQRVDERRSASLALSSELSDAPQPIIEATLRGILSRSVRKERLASASAELHTILSDSSHTKSERVSAALDAIEIESVRKPDTGSP
jgi:hypothetical protein